MLLLVVHFSGEDGMDGLAAKDADEAPGVNRRGSQTGVAGFAPEISNAVVTARPATSLATAPAMPCSSAKAASMANALTFAAKALRIAARAFKAENVLR